MYVVDSVIAKKDLGKGVEVTRERLGLIEIFGLMNDKTNNANTCIGLDDQVARIKWNYILDSGTSVDSWGVSKVG